MLITIKKELSQVLPDFNIYAFSMDVKVEDSAIIDDKIKELAQSVNLNKDYPSIASYTIYDHLNNLTFIDNFKIYEINLEKIKEIWYNKDTNESILSMLDMNLEELLNVKCCKSTKFFFQPLKV